MFNRKNLASGLLAAGFGFMLISPAIADDDYEEMMATIKAVGLIPIEQASEKALAAKPGKIVDAELDERTWPKGWDYEFEIVDADGNEWDVDVNAKSGEVVKVKRDWF